MHEVAHAVVLMIFRMLRDIDEKVILLIAVSDVKDVADPRCDLELSLDGDPPAPNCTLINGMMPVLFCSP